MTEQEHIALHRDHRARIERLEANLVTLAQNTERITTSHNALLKVHKDAIAVMEGMWKQMAGQIQQINGLGRFGETFTPRVNTQPGGTRSVPTLFVPRVGSNPLNVHEEDAEIADD